MNTQTAYSSPAASVGTVWDEAPLPPRHLKVTGAAPAFGFERCEDVACSVGGDGTASSCGRLACPACGCGGTNLALVAPVDTETTRVHCSCGYTWVRAEHHPALGAGLGSTH